MDPNKTIEQPTVKPITVMDIQPPQSAPASVAVAAPPVEAPVPQPSPEVPVTETTPAPVTDASVAQPESPAPVAAAPEAQPESEAPEQPVIAPLVAKPAESKHHKTPLLAIIIAVLIASCLAVFAVLAYMNSKDQQPAANQQNSTTGQSDAASATTEADAATKAVEDMVSDDKATDLDDSSINDANLGL